MLKKLLLVLACALSFSAPGLAQNARLARQGHVARTNYLVELPFRYVDRHLFIDVVIRGKTYNFLLDSGYELSAFDTAIGAEIGVVPKAKVAVSGSSFSSQQARLVDLPRLGIAAVEFDGTAAVLQDLSLLKKRYGCLQVHGIIGNNVMRKAAWQIDYQRQVVRLADRSTRFAVEAHAIPLRMTSKGWGLARLDVDIDGTESGFIFDLGSSGGFTAAPALRQRIDPDGKASYLRSGTNSRFVAGAVRVGGITLADSIVSLETGVASLVGNEFFEHYRVTIDWSKDMLWLEPGTPIPAGRVSAFEVQVYPDYADNTLRVRKQWDAHRLSPAVEDGTQVLRIGNTDVSAFSREKLCGYWAGKQQLLGENSLDLLLKTGEAPRAITLTRKQLLPRE